MDETYLSVDELHDPIDDSQPVVNKHTTVDYNYPELDSIGILERELWDFSKHESTANQTLKIINNIINAMEKQGIQIQQHFHDLSVNYCKYLRNVIPIEVKYGGEILRKSLFDIYLRFGKNKSPDNVTELPPIIRQYINKMKTEDNFLENIIAEFSAFHDFYIQSAEEAKEAIKKLYNKFINSWSANISDLILSTEAKRWENTINIHPIARRLKIQHLNREIKQ